MRATVDLSRVKQKFSAASRKLKQNQSVPKPHNQDDEPVYINLQAEAEDVMAPVITEAEAEIVAMEDLEAD